MSIEEYVEWKHGMFRKLNALPPNSAIASVKRLDSRTQTYTYSCRFFTSSIYKIERAIFYPNG